jgi:HPt (histidine-containing phosphotransfer) domain-containing protein
MDIIQHGEIDNIQASRLFICGFLRHTSNQLKLLQQALHCRSFREVHRIAHSLKGTALNLRDADLAKAARRLEAVAFSLSLVEQAELFHLIVSAAWRTLAEKERELR